MFQGYSLYNYVHYLLSVTHRLCVDYSEQADYNSQSFKSSSNVTLNTMSGDFISLSTKPPKGSFTLDLTWISHEFHIWEQTVWWCMSFVSIFDCPYSICISVASKLTSVFKFSEGTGSNLLNCLWKYALWNEKKQNERETVGDLYGALWYIILTDQFLLFNWAWKCPNFVTHVSPIDNLHLYVLT